MKSDHYVIIGNGPAGNSAADELRKNDPDARITIISDEFFPYYNRHMLRQYIIGEKSRKDLVVRSTAHYQKHRIRLRLGQRVIKADLETNTLYLKHMEKVGFTRLLLCLGGKPRIPETTWSFAKHFTVLKSLADADKLKACLPDTQSFVIIGGDLISVRMSTSLLKVGKEVTFIVDEDAFWPLQLSAEERREFEQNLTKKGARVITGDVLAGIEKESSGYRVMTRDGKTLICDRVGAFFGSIPDVDFLIGSGLDIDRGILVNEFLQTQFKSVYAAGDCAQIYNPAIRNYWVSIGWDNALRLGQIAAHNMLGTADKVDMPPVNSLKADGIAVKTSWWRDL
jgi:3-phenylpropionate/trans-cinnamate dioxygenase ferredoxin reductase component